MPGLKEIKRRLRSVRNTKKITYAMKLVAAAKLRKSQDSVTSLREYTKALNTLLIALRAEQEDSDYSHPLMAEPEQLKRVGVIVIGGNRGLCGGYNSNLNRRFYELYSQLRGDGLQVEVATLGRKPTQFCRRIKVPLMYSNEELPEDAVRWPIEQFLAGIERTFLEKEVDRVYLVYTKFRSALSVKPVSEQLLPLSLPTEVESFEPVELVPPGLTIFEPSTEAVFKRVIPQILRTRFTQAALDAKASEHGSRMTAMDSATKNAGELTTKLQLTHNKLRQSAVTADLLDIVGGAEALNKA